MLKMKSAQTRQIFFYIFALIVMAFILYFGFLLIPKVTNLFCEVESGKLKTSLETEIGKVYHLGPESSRRLNIPSSCGLRQLCFVGNDPNFRVIEDETSRRIIELRHNENPEENVFILTEDDVEPLKIENIDVKQGTLCILPQGNSLSFRAENKGDYVEIS